MLARIGARRAGGGRGLEPPRRGEPRPSAGLRASTIARLAPGRERLVRAGHEGVGPGGQGVRRQRRVEAEVRTPRGVHDERDAGRVRHRRLPGHVADGTHVGRVAEQDGTCVGGGGQRRPATAAAVTPVGRPAAGSTSGRTQTGSRPARTSPSSIERCSVRATTTRSARGARRRVRAPGCRASTRRRRSGPVAAPEQGRPRLRFGEPAARLLHRVEAAVERHVTAHHVTDQVGPVLVAGDRERGGHLLLEAQPGVEQRRVAAQPPRVSRHARPPIRRPRW